MLSCLIVICFIISLLSAYDRGPEDQKEVQQHEKV